MDDPRAATVLVFTGRGCHLCDAALDVIRAVREDIAFELRIIEIDGNDDLEERYRELLPVVEIDGERAFTFFVGPAALRERLLRPRSGGAGRM
jgi:glutaredoxin